MVASYIARSASKAADSGFLWLSVSRWETRDKHVGEMGGDSSSWDVLGVEAMLVTTLLYFRFSKNRRRKLSK